MKTWDFIKANFSKILSVITAIIGFIFLRQYFQSDLKAKLKNSETDAESKVLDERMRNVTQNRAEEEARAKAQREQLGQSSNGTVKNNLDYWNKK
jgi:hypothetical protein